jgi:hypothetical protein
LENKIIRFSQVDKIINETKAVSKLPSGTVIAEVKDDYITYEGYFGYADIAENKKQMPILAFILLRLISRI